MPSTVDDDDLKAQRGRSLRELHAAVLPLKHHEHFHAHVSTGLPELDHAFGSGLPSQQIIQFAGAAGTGKTQMCLHLAVQMLLRPLSNTFSSAVIWIHSEGIFPVQRLHQLLVNRAGVCTTEAIGNLLDHVFVNHVKERSELPEVLSRKLPQVVRKCGAKLVLIVIDSIANLFRHIEEIDYSEENSAAALRPQYIQRSFEFLTVVGLLRQYCNIKSCFVVIANQATTDYREGDVPALGKVWNSLIDINIWLERDKDRGHRPELQGQKSYSTFLLRVDKSPFSPPLTVKYCITDSGIVPDESVSASVNSCMS